MQLQDIAVGESLGVEVPYGNGGKMETMEVVKVGEDCVHVDLYLGSGCHVVATLPFEDLVWEDREWVFYMPKTRLQLNPRSPLLQEKARSCLYRRVRSAMDRVYPDPKEEARKRRRMRRRKGAARG